MDIVEFINYRNETMESIIVNKDIIYDSSMFPEGAVGLNYYRNNEKVSSYLVGKQLENLNVVKIVNDEMYEKFIKFSKENAGAKYLIVVYDCQVYFLCALPETIVVSSFQELEANLLKEMCLQIETIKK